MISIWFALLALIIILLVAFYFYNMQFSSRKMPPGPLNFPIFGSALGILSFGSFKALKDINCLKIWEYFQIASKKYGGLFSFTCGKFTGVIFTDYEMLREIENLDEYSHKISNQFTVVRSHNKELGLIFAMSPELWVEMRKFSLRTLREFGFGKRSSMQSIIEMEITELVSQFKEETAINEGVLTIRTNFMLSLLNIMWCMIAGQRYAHDDPNLTQLLAKNFAIMKIHKVVDPLTIAFPFLREWFPRFFKWDETKQILKEIHEYSQSLINERRKIGAYLNEPENFIDCFLQKIENHIHNPLEKNYTDENLQIMIEDFLQAGFPTSLGTLNYALLFLTLNPEEQEKCWKEINAIVPKNMVPTMEDIERMPYFQATILETHRLACVLPIPIPRVVPKDWHYKEWIIPKGTIIISNHYSVLMDEDYWKDPETFRPSRFINKSGKFIPDKRVINFGLGKRYCVGITLVNSVIPIYIATLIQNFKFSAVPGENLPTMEPEVGVTLSPKEFRCRVTQRF